MMKTILISAGHSDADPGAVSPDGRHTEARLALRLREAVAARLRELGAPTLTDGAASTNLSLSQAIRLTSRADIEVEFHFNAGPASATGVECFAQPRDKALAQLLALAVAQAAGLKVRGERGFKPERESQHQKLGFVRAGGLILEICFISNPSDLTAYLRAEVQVARAVAEALVSYARK